jgi:lysophospholipase L1-like esterase
MPRRPSYRILCVGDSLTVGAWKDESSNLWKASSYGGFLQSELASQAYEGVAVKVAAFCGATTEDISKLLQEELAASAAWDLVFIMAGTNDYARGKQEADIVRAVQDFHYRCHSRGIKSAILLPPLIGGRTSKTLTHLLHEWAYARRGNVSILADTALLVPLTDGSNRAVDGLHFTSKGSARLAHGLSFLVLCLFHFPNRLLLYI